MKRKTGIETSRLDDAARAGWLYYVAGDTQDEIARKLGVSRQSAQRLVSLAVSERLVKVRVDHPIAKCMELSSRLVDRFELLSCEVVPSDPEAPAEPFGLAEAAAEEMEKHFSSKTPKIIAFGTGRTLRASVDQITAMNCPQHKIVSLLGNMMSDGSASAYNVIIRLADRTNARHFPMPLPVFAKTREELQLMHGQKAVHNIIELARQADAIFAGIGNLGPIAPLAIDGFVSLDEMRALKKAGGVGEITGWVYDRGGQLLDGLTNDLLASAPLRRSPGTPMFGIAAGHTKVPAILGALKGRLINCLITNESTAEQLLTD